MLITLKGTINKVTFSKSGLVATVHFEEYFPKKDQTMTHYLTCFISTYNTFKDVFESITYERGVDSVVVEIMIGRERKISQKAVYKEGHEKAGQPFEYFEDAYKLTSIKKY